MAEVVDETIRIYPCPLPDCRWSMIGELPGPAESEGALAEMFGPGVFGAVARADRLRRTEQQITEHLTGHSTQEFAVALANANKRIAELESAVSRA
jgi:hypothetical protein